MNNKLYTPPNPALWTGRVDSETDAAQFRFHQVVRCALPEDLADISETVLLGFACDEGVRRNKGRLGAAGGPDYFRQTIGSLSWHGDEAGFVDAGTLHNVEDKLEEAQAELGEMVHHLLKKSKKTVVIGGGHETAFGHYLGIANFLKESEPEAKLGILNIDAHFDLRPYNGIPHSGSPFLQAHNHAALAGLDLTYFVYGINRLNNTKSLFDTARLLGTNFVTNNDIFGDEPQSLKAVKQFIESRSHLYLTICLDVFEASAAPGVSAPAWNGIRLHHALKVINLVKKSGKLISADVCELNPGFDEHAKTAKLAGVLFGELVN